MLYFKEEDIRIMLQKHMESRESDISRLEGTGALNFLSIDDLPVGDEGEVVDPVSIIHLETEFDLPVFPAFQRIPDDPFLLQIQLSGKKWVILTSVDGNPDWYSMQIYFYAMHFLVLILLDHILTVIALLLYLML